MNKMNIAQTWSKKRPAHHSRKKRKQNKQYSIRFYIFIIIILAWGLLLGWGLLNRVEIKQETKLWWQKKDLPPLTTIKITPSSENQKKSKETLASVSVKLPVEINLAVPFTSQAPYAIWDDLHKEACEEASAIMLANFFQGRKEINKETAELAIQELVAWENNRFGYFKDTTAVETATILQEYFGIENVRSVVITSVEDIKKELAAGWPVLVPAAGQLLKNPYYHQPGPLYHMLVIKGYTKDGRFITNDPGTRWGADYTYEFDILYNAIHDWNRGDVLNGRKVMIVIKK